MIQDLGRFGWRVGMILIFAVPALYFLAGIVPYLVRDAGHPVVQTLLWLQTIVPGLVMTIALGVSLCLLVRIERHLNPTKDEN
jgi:hypothetical protein